jgi:MFS transporter, OFA family, oxalate/formate antiporter
MTRNPGWKVVFAGTGINLALGILYAWSIFKTAIEKDLGWDPAKLNDPYAICCLVFSFSMILAGRCQDKIGPRWTATLGGVLVAIGLALASQSHRYGVWVLGFGVLVGIGMGFGYSSATPPALKWFPASETGKVAGIVVAGFGLAPLYIAPLTETLLKMGGLQLASAFYAGFFLLVVCGLATCLKNPTTPAGAKSDSKVASGISLSPSAMLKTREFYLLWLVYFIGAGAGLMVISSMNGMAKKSMGDYAFLAVIVLAIGNAAGRVVAGVVSDWIGRKATLLIVTLLQAGCMLLSIPVTQQGHYALLIVLLATMIGFNYGANLCLFPAFIKDLCGLTNFGVNYGILFTSWGIGGFVLSRFQQMLKASSGDFRSSFIVAAGLLLFGATITLFLKGPKKADLA